MFSFYIINQELFHVQKHAKIQNINIPGNQDILSPSELQYVLTNLLYSPDGLRVVQCGNDLNKVVVEIQNLRP